MVHLILATRNEHKVREIGTILGTAFRCVGMTRFNGVPNLEESGKTFAENAAGKAKQLDTWLIDCPEFGALSGLDGRIFVVADDSGLEVDYLGGAPGVHSARFAADNPTKTGNSKDSDNNAKLVRLLRNVPANKRTARFR